jgi:hypothetical protein
MVWHASSPVAYSRGHMLAQIQPTSPDIRLHLLQHAVCCFLHNHMRSTRLLSHISHLLKQSRKVLLPLRLTKPQGSTPWSTPYTHGVHTHKRLMQPEAGLR